MTVKIGPLGDGSDGFSMLEQYAAIFFLPAFVLLDYSVTPSINYDWRNNILRLHGESNSPGDEYNRAMIVALSAMLVMTAVYGFILQFSGWMQAFAILFGGPALVGSVYVVVNCEVIDHTRGKVKDEALVELQEQFAEGEMDQAEFEERVEAKLDRNGDGV